MTEFKRRLIKKFGDQINNMSCVYLDRGDEHLTEIMRHVKPSVVVEIGTFQAVSACLMAQYADHVYTIDIEEQPLAEKVVKFCGSDNVSRVIVANNDEKSKHLDTINSAITIDLIHVDGEHFHGEAIADLKLVQGMAPWILVHDYQPGFKEVWDMVNDLDGYDMKVYGAFALLREK